MIDLFLEFYKEVAMSLFEQWNAILEGKGLTQAQTDDFWNAYLAVEKNIYEDILNNKTEKLTGTVKAFGEKYDLDPMLVVGFVDGISTSLTEELDLNALTEDSELDATIDFEKLYFNMHKAKAEWLYKIPAWDDILTKDKMKEIKQNYVDTVTVRVENKLGRNDLCHCGSGKKYKKCCLDKDQAAQ